MYKEFLLFVGLLGIGTVIGSVSEETKLNEILQEETGSLSSTRIFESQITNILECLRQQIKQGIPIIGSLDPLQFPVLPLISNNTILKGLTIFKKLRLDGLAGFEITNVKFSLRTQKLDLSLKFPKIRFAAGYTGQMKLLEKIDLFGKGDLSFDFNDFDITVVVKMKIFPLSIDEFKLDLILPSTNAVITGLFHDEYISGIVSKQLSKTLTALTKQEEERINAFVNTAAWNFIDSVINEFLKKLTWDDILEIIKGGGGEDCTPVLMNIVQVVNKTLTDVLGLTTDYSLLDNYVDYNIDDVEDDDNYY